MNHKNCPTCHQEIKKRFPDGVEWNTVRTECDCQIDNVLIADNKNEDCRANDVADQARGICEFCNKKKRVVIINHAVVEKEVVA